MFSVGCFLIVLLISTSETFARRQDLIVYSQGNYNGASMTFSGNIADFGEDLSFVNNAQSWRSFGYWIGFVYNNFTGYQKSYGLTDGTGSGCQFCSTELRSLRSIRHLGAPDYSDVGLSLYNSTNFVGTEFFVNDSHADIPITVKSFASSGKSAWVFFSEPNFEGESRCSYAPLQSVRYTPNYENSFPWPLKSVKLGC